MAVRGGGGAYSYPCLSVTMVSSSVVLYVNTFAGSLGVVLGEFYAIRGWILFEVHTVIEQKINRKRVLFKIARTIV